MRKLLYVWLAVFLIVPSLMQLRTINAAQSDSASQATIEQSGIIGLPDYDIRHEMAKYELSSRSSSAAKIESAAAKARLDSVDRFRETLAPSERDKLQAEFNEAGVPKVFFNHVAPLSAAKTGAPDTIARDFLKSNTGIFGLSAREIRRLKLENVDDDEGTTFISYKQTISGLTVFQGQ